MNTLFRIGIISFVLFAILVGDGFSQPKQKNLSGHFTDTDGGRIADARIAARNQAGIEQFSVISNAAGNFSVEYLPVGNYRIIVEADGFSSASREVALTDTSDENLEISLSVGNISESVTVTATRTELTTMESGVAVSVVERKNLERQNPNSIWNIFQNLPGTSTVNEGAFQVRPRIRGLDSNRVVILVDGERLNNARTSTANSGVEVGLVEVGQIQALEVARGAGSLLYGTDALAGTVNIITKDTPRRNEDGFRVGAAFNGFASSNEDGRRGGRAVNGSGRLFALRVFQSLERFGNYSSGDAPFIADSEVLNSRSHAENTQANARFFLNDQNTLKFNYDRRRAFDIGSPTLVGVFNAFFPFSNREKFSTGFERTKFNRYFARFSVSGYYQKQKRNFTNILNVPATPPFFRGSSSLARRLPTQALPVSMYKAIGFWANEIF